MANKVELTTPSECELAVIRSFNAARTLVWDCHTKPELVRRWLLGPEGWTMPVCEIDLVVGGRYRYVWRREPSDEMGMGGIFREIAAPAKLVSNEVFDDDWTGGETLVTQTFVESAGKTTVTVLVRYASKEARDGAMRTGMTSGMEQGYERLDAVLGELV